VGNVDGDGGGMHDFHAVKALVDGLTAGDGSASDIAEVRIRVSVLLSQEAVQQAFEMLTQDTPLRGSRLVVEPWPDERECPACGDSTPVVSDDLLGHLVICPSCGAPSPIGDGAAIELVEVVRGGVATTRGKTGVGPSVTPC
jgi:Zn finger protein HypA/HybF involved in hydrogenase expression